MKIFTKGDIRTIIDPMTVSDIGTSTLLGINGEMEEEIRDEGTIDVIITGLGCTSKGSSALFLAGDPLNGSLALDIYDAHIELGNR